MHKLVDLAKRTVEEYVKNGRILTPPDPLDDEMTERAGVFVCLKKGGELRGCIGTFNPCRKNIEVETIFNAISAATQDPRFVPVSADELSEIEYSVDVLTEPERVADASSLDPAEFGVILQCGSRKGLLLPALEGVNSVAEQLRIVRMKAGILPDEKVEIYRFRVKRYK